MYKPEAGPARPVLLDKHYELFKIIEAKVNTHLGGLDHEYFVVGLRVAYDELDSSNEPGVLPFTVEFGQLGPVDEAARCTKDAELGEEELLAAAKNAPIPLDFLDDLLSYSKQELEAASGTALNVGVAIVLTGSATLGYSVSCPCKNKTKKRYCYYNRPIHAVSCYCTTKNC